MTWRPGQGIGPLGRGEGVAGGPLDLSVREQDRTQAPPSLDGIIHPKGTPGMSSD